MPLVAHNALPSFQRLREEGITVLDIDRAAHQDIRELHVGLLNMMPDAALGATERQFFRLISESNPIAQFYVHPFTLPELPRGEHARQHIERYYDRFEKVRKEGVDALIITGANVTSNYLPDQAFWEPLKDVIDWAEENVTSVFCSCLATHAVLHMRYGQERVHQGQKIWGVYKHRVVDKTHPLVNDINTRFDAPHSRFNDISRAQFDTAGLRVLAESDRAGVHLATSEDGLRFVLSQGHPEYDTISLLKEYKREVLRYARGERDEYPPYPERYISLRSKALLAEFKSRLQEAMDQGTDKPEMPEDLVIPSLDNTWHDTAGALVGKWIGLVYQVTHSDRRKPYMDHIDPNNPLHLDL